MTAPRRPHGVGDPVQAFRDLQPLADALRAMQRDCPPMGADYMALGIALAGLEAAATHFTGWRTFYGAQGTHR